MVQKDEKSIVTWNYPNKFNEIIVVNLKIIVLKSLNLNAI